MKIQEASKGQIKAVILMKNIWEMIATKHN